MSGTPYVSRINQIDAVQLNVEIYKILKSQTREVTRLCSQEKVEQWQPEIDALLKFVIWYFSLAKSESTFGQRLLDLNYANLSRRKAIFYLVLNVVPQYIQDKFADKRRVASSESNARLRWYIETTANLIHLMSFCNLLLFLHQGKQPSIIERLLGITSKTASKQRPRQIGYSYMTRELLWHGLMELFSVGLPMINFHYLKQALVRFWTKRTSSKEKRVPRPTMDLHTRCPYCNETPILPTYADCEHIYCHYCMNAHFATMDRFQCLKCGTELHINNAKVYVPSTQQMDLTVFEEEL